MSHHNYNTGNSGPYHHYPYSADPNGSVYMRNGNTQYSPVYPHEDTFRQNLQDHRYMRPYPMWYESPVGHNGSEEHLSSKLRYFHFFFVEYICSSQLTLCFIGDGHSSSPTHIERPVVQHNDPVASVLCELQQMLPPK